ncbi:hypothetical protein BDP81DRAFT_218674 [Colletotrichum phormii]|uniref:Uncharacterized protein n=1 Tax=Colletotrichum phormii TaxID=359342 RepID=A0AAI9ZUZ8_9PEZI|nr:uncharacterized protein BDP81DRAFT_218674 [Colletotrichum phormii]KAK1637112.1 hypothetical protein BDP81DRAFT_218674 [Colletotrichum phormii]
MAHYHHLQIWSTWHRKVVTYDHTHWKTRDPVRSPIDKPMRAGLVVGSVTTSEYLVLYVFDFWSFGDVTRKLFVGSKSPAADDNVLTWSYTLTLRQDSEGTRGARAARLCLKSLNRPK